MTNLENLCINCKADLLTESSRVEYLSIGTVNVDIKKSISFIFTSKITNVNGLYICQSCAVALSHLYKSKVQFLERSNKISKIQGIIGQPMVNAENADELNSSLINVEEILPNDPKDDEIFKENKNSPEKLIIPPDSSLSNIDFQELYFRIKIDKLPDTPKLNIENSFSRRINKPIKCKDCSRQLETAELLNNHRNSSHRVLSKKFSCPRCPKKFVLQWFLDHHYSICQNKINIVYSCSICKQNFSQKENLENHKLKIHDIRKYPYVCNQCTESYKTIKELRRHLLESHKGTSEFHAAVINIKSRENANKRNKSCVVCQKSFEEAYSMRKHMKIRHGVGGIPCIICKRSFSNSMQRTEHYQSTHKKCDDCEKRFEKVYKLKKHLSKVHGRREFSYQCEMCGMTFERVSKLTSHYNYHVELAGPLNFCNICNKSYRLKGSLFLHLKRFHSAKDDEKKFKCKKKDCSSVFSQRYLLDRHLINFHKVKFKYSCKVCNRRFRSKSIVAYHFTRIHKPEEKSFKKSARVNTYLSNTTTSQAATGKIETTSCFSSSSLQFICPICGKSSEYKTHFQRHLKFHKASYYTDLYKEEQLPLVLKCKDAQCENRYSRMDNMLKHFKKYHDSNSKQFSPFFKTCTVCNAQVHNLFIKQHRQRHSTKIMHDEEMEDLNKFFSEKLQLFKCLVCQQEFEAQAQKEFTDHVISQHKLKVVTKVAKEKTDLLKIECPKCQKKFKSYYLLKSHDERVHVSLNRRVQCTQCERNFKAQEDLKRHMKRVHKTVE